MVKLTEKDFIESISGFLEKKFEWNWRGSIWEYLEETTISTMFKQNQLKLKQIINSTKFFVALFLFSSTNNKGL